MITAFDTPDQLTQTIITNAKIAKYLGAGRYISGGGSWKHLTTNEITLCKTNNFGLFLIDEGTGDAAQFSTGIEGGNKAGAKAAAICNQLNVPPDTPIFVGVDFGADQSNVTDIHNYMIGYATACIPYKAGMYADGLIASQVPTAVGDFVPGASGWPGTKEYLKSGKVALIQHPPVKMFGIDVDPVEIVDTSVLWLPGGSTVQVSSVTVNTTSKQNTSSVALTATSVAMSTKDTIKAIQKLLGVRDDGILGPLSQAAWNNLLKG